MKIYGSLASPFVQRVLMAARIKGHELPVEMPPGGAMQSDAFRAISPMGRIPVLDDDGWTVAESAAILGYLEDRLDGPTLYPGDARERAHIRQIESLVLCELAGLRPIMVCEVFRMRDQPEVAAAGRDQVSTGLQAIERARAQGRFASGDSPSAADCILTPLLTLMEIVDPMAGTLKLLQPFPGLRTYRAAMDDHPVIGRSAHEMRAAFREVMARRAAQAVQPTAT